MQEQIEKFWKIDGYGSTRNKDSVGLENVSREDLRAEEILEKTTRMREGHCETGLLWKRENIELPKNRKLAEKRLMSLKRKFRRDAKFEEIY